MLGEKGAGIEQYKLIITEQSQSYSDYNYIVTIIVTES